MALRRLAEVLERRGPTAPALATTPRAVGAFVFAAVIGGLAAGIVAGLLQVVLWLVFTDAFPAILWRDIRLTAAIALGPEILESQGRVDAKALASATVIHFWLSAIYAAVLFALCDGLPARASAWIGAVFGALLYLVNLYGFTTIFPWFAVARDVITLLAHLAFGVTAALVARWTISRPPADGTGGPA